MSIDFENLKNLRSALILSAVKSFDPDVFIVDKAPLGMKREVLSDAEVPHAASGLPRFTVLGLRDVLDDPAASARTGRTVA